VKIFSMKPLLLILFFLPTVLFSQLSEEDSLIYHVEHSPNDSLKIWHLRKYSSYLYKNKKFEQELMLLYTMDSICDLNIDGPQSEYFKGVKGIVHNTLGIIYKKKGFEATYL